MPKCDNGCGRVARYKNSNGKFRCEEKESECPAKKDPLKGMTLAEKQHQFDKKQKLHPVDRDKRTLAERQHDFDKKQKAAKPE